MQRIKTLRIGGFRKEGRAILAPLVLFAFLLQIVAVQTHIHFPVAGTTVIEPTGPVAPSTVHPAKKSGDAGTAHCPWCQAVLSTGNYLTPAALPVALPVSFRLLEPIVLPAPIAASASSHAWQSRAPPA